MHRDAEATQRVPVRSRCRAGSGCRGRTACVRRRASSHGRASVDPTKPQAPVIKMRMHATPLGLHRDDAETACRTSARASGSFRYSDNSPQRRREIPWPSCRAGIGRTTRSTRNPTAPTPSASDTLGQRQVVIPEVPVRARAGTVIFGPRQTRRPPGFRQRKASRSVAAERRLVGQMLEEVAREHGVERAVVQRPARRTVLMEESTTGSPGAAAPTDSDPCRTSARARIWLMNSPQPQPRSSTAPLLRALQRLKEVARQDRPDTRVR